MRSRVNERFRKAFDALPEEIQRQARTAYARFWIGSHADYDKLLRGLRG